MTRSDNIKAGLKLKLDSRRRQQADAAEALQKADREKIRRRPAHPYP